MSDDTDLSESLSEAVPASLCSTESDDDFEGEIVDDEAETARKKKRKAKRNKFLKKVKAQKERHAEVRKKHKNDEVKKKAKAFKRSKKATETAVVTSQSKKYPDTIISHIS